MSSQLLASKNPQLQTFCKWIQQVGEHSPGLLLVHTLALSLYLYLLKKQVLGIGVEPVQFPDPDSTPPVMQKWEAAVMARVTGFLTLTRETRAVLLAPSSDLSPAQAVASI